MRAADDKHLMTFVLSPGQRHDARGFEPLMVGGAVKRSGRGRPSTAQVASWVTKPITDQSAQTEPSDSDAL